MAIRRELGPLLWTGAAATLATAALLLLYCHLVDTRTVHLAVLAILTTAGPLLARVFEGLVRRRQRIAGLELNCLEADDEILVARTVPLVLPVIGAAWAYLILL
jgi:hypothetical protein